MTGTTFLPVALRPLALEHPHSEEFERLLQPSWRIRVGWCKRVGVSTGPTVQATIERALGEVPGALARAMFELRRAGLTPTSPRGGGRNSVSFTAEHYARTIFALAAHRPSEIPRTVRTLDFCRAGETSPANVAPMAPSAGLAVTHFLHTLAEHFSQGEHLTAESVAMVESCEVILCADPASVVISMDDGGTERVIYRFGDQPTATPPLRRLVVLTGAVVVELAKLLAEAIINQNAISAVQFLDRTRKDAAGAAEKNNAEDLCQEAPALPVDNQARPRGNGNKHTSQVLSDGSGEGASLQERRPGRVGRPREFEATT